MLLIILWLIVPLIMLPIRPRVTLWDITTLILLLPKYVWWYWVHQLVYSSYSQTNHFGSSPMAGGPSSLPRSTSILFRSWPSFLFLAGDHHPIRSLELFVWKQRLWRGIGLSSQTNSLDSQVHSAVHHFYWRLATMDLPLSSPRPTGCVSSLFASSISTFK